MALSGGAGLKLTIAKYYTPSGKLIQRNYRDKEKAEEGGICPDVEVYAPVENETKIFRQYNEIVYTPGKKEPELKLTEKDPVLDKAVALLTGKISLEEAKAQAEKEAQERKEKKEKAAATQSNKK
jgi:C-terminal processing protease CtpA/Prc